jgi:hypothetical protein
MWLHNTDFFLIPWYFLYSFKKRRHFETSFHGIMKFVRCALLTGHFESCRRNANMWCTLDVIVIRLMVEQMAGYLYRVSEGVLLSGLAMKVTDTQRVSTLL